MKLPKVVYKIWNVAFYILYWMEDNYRMHYFDARMRNQFSLFNLMCMDKEKKKKDRS